MEKKTKTISRMLKVTKRATTEFQYVVQRPSKARICFGSGQERDKFLPLSRHEVHFTEQPLSTLAPGMYPVPADPAISRPVSKRGTVIAGRTAVRYPPISDEKSPGPAAYTVPIPSAAPGAKFTFGPRFKARKKFNTVGPGYYKPSTVHRTMAFARSFGGKLRLIPAIEMKCGPFNFDTCEICKNFPVGDYWQLISQVANSTKKGVKVDEEVVHLCRNCYSSEKQQPSRFSRQQMINFKKVRDCSKVHYHGGCEARLLLMPPRDMDKIQEKEAYLSMYFP